MADSTEKSRQFRKHLIRILLGWTIVMAGLSAVLLVILISYRLEVTNSGYKMTDLWGSGRIRAIPVGADRLVSQGHETLGLVRPMLPVCLVGSTLAVIAALTLRSKREAIMALVGLATSVVAVSIYLQTEFILAGI